MGTLSLSIGIQHCSPQAEWASWQMEALKDWAGDSEALGTAGLPPIFFQDRILQLHYPPSSHSTFHQNSWHLESLSLFLSYTSFYTEYWCQGIYTYSWGLAVTRTLKTSPATVRLQHSSSYTKQEARGDNCGHSETFSESVASLSSEIPRESFHLSNKG